MITSQNSIKTHHDLPKRINRRDCIENFILFIKNDMLGEVANLHSKIADSKRDAIETETCLKLAEMHSKAVDFQKHGEMLDIDEFEILKRKNNYNVDFMSHGKKTIKRMEVVESPGVLGQMFRQLKVDMDKDELIILEYKFKIQRDYPINSYAEFNPKILKHLVFFYKNVIKPYNDEIRQLMFDKGVATESDIFNSNCAFSNLVSSSDEKYGHQDDIEILMYEFEERFKHGIIKEYRKTLSPEDRKFKDLDHAIKFATYFDLKHLEDPALDPYREEEEFQNLVKTIEKDNLKDEIDSSEEMSFDEFKRIISSQYNEEFELRQVIDRVKLFSAWWMLTD